MLYIVIMKRGTNLFVIETLIIYGKARVFQSILPQAFGSIDWDPLF